MLLSLCVQDHTEGWPLIAGKQRDLFMFAIKEKVPLMTTVEIEKWIEHQTQVLSEKDPIMLDVLLSRKHSFRLWAAACENHNPCAESINVDLEHLIGHDELYPKHQVIRAFVRMGLFKCAKEYVALFKDKRQDYTLSFHITTHTKRKIEQTSESTAIHPTDQSAKTKPRTA